MKSIYQTVTAAAPARRLATIRNLAEGFPSFRVEHFAPFPCCANFPAIYEQIFFRFLLAALWSTGSYDDANSQSSPRALGFHLRNYVLKENILNATTFSTLLWETDCWAAAFEAGHVNRNSWCERKDPRGVIASPKVPQIKLASRQLIENLMGSARVTPNSRASHLYSRLLLRKESKYSKEVHLTWSATVWSTWFSTKRYQASIAMP